jgi:hypothetical protein
LKNKKSTLEQKKQAREEQKTHGESHTKERMHLHERMIQCRANFDDFLMVYLDGMDQSKTHIPQFSKKDSREQEVLGMRS